MTPDQLEFAISQYLDGVLSPLEQAALEERLAQDADARALLEEYRRLETILKQAPAAPILAWDRLHRHFSDLLANEEVPLRNYSLGWIATLQRVAIAASIVLLVGLGLQSYRSYSSSATTRRVEVVIGPRAESPNVPRIEQIAIGAAPAAEENWRYADGVLGRSAVVLIDRASGPVQDMDPMPY